MCNPGLALAGAGAVGKAGGEHAAAKGEKAGLYYQATVYENNAQYDTWRAEDAIQRGQTEEGRHRMKVSQLQGTQRASIAGRGIALDEGSPLNILEDTEYMGELDAMTIRDNANKEAWGHRIAAQNNRSNAALSRAQADAINPRQRAKASLLSSAAQFGSQWGAPK